MKKFLDNVSSQEAEKLNILMAEFFYGCNVSFNTADSKYFKNFISALRPAYKSPNRKLIAGSLLDKVHDKMNETNQKMAQKMDKQAILLVDGWTNSSANHENVVTMLSTANDENIFLESYNFSEIQETSVNLLEAIKKSIELAKERYDIDVIAVVTDNARNMTSMGDLLLPNVLFTTCHSHTGNLLAKDLISLKKFQTILTKVMTVQKKFQETWARSTIARIWWKKIGVIFSNSFCKHSKCYQIIY